MTLNSAMALAEIATTYPALTRELERLGLDYCCKGQRSLAAACQQKGLDPDRVVEDLSSQPMTAEPPAVWIKLSPAELVDHLEATHHRYLKQELPRLRELAAKVSPTHGERYPELIRVEELLTELWVELEPHLRKEEEEVFPMVRTLASATTRPGFAAGSLTKPIAELRDSHTIVGALLERLRMLTHGYQTPADTCASTQALMAGLAELEADTHLHVHKENNHLFPAVLSLEDRIVGQPQEVHT